MDEFASLIIEEGGIDACVCALRANQNRLDVVRACTAAMITLARKDDGAIAIARQGGTRQIINTIQVLFPPPCSLSPFKTKVSLVPPLPSFGSAFSNWWMVARFLSLFSFDAAFSLPLSSCRASVRLVPSCPSCPPPLRLICTRRTTSWRWR